MTYDSFQIREAFCIFLHNGGCIWLLGPLFIVTCRYGVDLIYKQQPLIRGRGVSYCKNLLSPRFEHSESMFS